MTNTLADHWSALATCALLGVDRRPAPPAPPGPLAALAVDRADAAPAERLLDAVAVLVAMRRGGLLPGPPVAPLPLVGDDPRPECSARAVDLLHALLEDWPHLLGEWVATAHAHHLRIPPDAVALLLARRSSPEVHDTVIEAAGPLARWLADVLPELFASTLQGARAKGRPAAPDAGVPLPPGVEPHPGESPDDYAARLAGSLASAALRAHHRAALVRVVSALPVAFLRPLIDRLARAATHPDTMGLVITLGELAQFRSDLHEELLP